MVFCESGELRKVNLEEVRVNIPLPSSSQDIVVPLHKVTPQPTQQVKRVEQYNENVAPLQENITTENIVESLQPTVLRRSQRERRPSISNDYVVYPLESDFDIGITSGRLWFHKPWKVMIPENGSIP